MDRKLEQDLREVFGGGMNVAPGGTGAILTRPSKLSLDVAAEAVKTMPLDGVYRDLGTVVARALADELEGRSLRAADYADLPDLPKVAAKRVVSYLMRSDEFAQALKQGLSVRG